MAVPDQTTIAAQVYSRLNGQLVPTYASAVWRAMAPEDSLPGASDKPIVVFATDADFAETDSTDDAAIAVTVYVIGHARALRSEMDTLVGQVSAALHRWTPTIVGIGTNPLRRVRGGDGAWDTEHVAETMTFETFFAEDS